MCGIAGIVNTTPKIFDYSTFCSLGISNDTRGGDSCGIFIDGFYEYGVGDNKLFSNYFQHSKLLNQITHSTVALVHCRKASVGNISEKTAQPVIISNNNKVEFVLMHNGTIYNYKELAKKYIPNINITDMTDSQVMAHIFYNSGYDVLQEYNGSAVFVIVDYRNGNPRTLLFRGSSKKYMYSATGEAERPLYYCIDKENHELVFSSIWTYLMALRRNCTTYALRTNELVEFIGDSLVLVSKYDRSKKAQFKEVEYEGKLSINHVSQDANISQYNYISINFLTNKYSYNNKLINGELRINDFGRVGKSFLESYNVWFFHGIALKDKSCFKFLDKLKKDSGLSDNDFLTKFENVIRFLSIDKIYPSGDLWYEATSPMSSKLFSGTWKPITAVTTIKFISGIRSGTIYGGEYNSIKSRINNKDINFKTLKEECMSLMK